MPQEPHPFWKEFHQDRENKQGHGAGPTPAWRGGRPHDMLSANVPLLFVEDTVPLNTAPWLQSPLSLQTALSRQNDSSILQIRKLRLREEFDLSNAPLALCTDVQPQAGMLAHPLWGIATPVHRPRPLALVIPVSTEAQTRFD